MSSKAIMKTGPLEKVGNFCQVDGKIKVIEYCDLPDSLANKTREDGSLVFELGSIGIHMVNRSFIESLNAGEFSLPIHRAVKKIPHVTGSGTPVDPQEPNGVKLETFVFDALPLAAKSIILQTIRSEEFGPVKNATGVDSAVSARQMQMDRAVGWLEAAGLDVPSGDPDKTALVEIGSSFALSADDVRTRREEIPSFEPGQPLYLA
jgi:UDP-N-acetylglucosamine/UDP-N-acetylgalactosamine diphosphorylase